MSNTNRDYAIVYDVKNSSLTLSRPLIFYITDKNTSNIFVRLVTRVSVGNGIDQYTNIENASNYVLTMRVIKPSNEVKSLEATQHEEGSIFQFDLTEDFKDIPGKYICELTISTIVNSRQELITSDPFNYEVKRSILSNVGEIIETEDTTVEKLLNDLEATKSEVSSQIKDVANKKLDKNTTDISVYQINKNLGKFDQTYMTDEFLQQIAGNTPINAVVGDNTVSNDKLMNDCVDYNNVTFIKKSIMNLFDKNSISNEGYIMEHNALVENTNGCISDYIPVKGNTIYTYSSKWSGTWFDSAKNYIADKPYGESTFTSPANAKFYRQNINKLNLNTVMFVEGNILPESYVGFGEYSIEFAPDFNEKIKDNLNNITPDKTTFMKLLDDNNLFDKTKTTDNYIIETNGTVVASDVGCISDFIPVKSGKTYYFTTNWNGAWYDINKEYISLKAYGDTNAVAPERAKFLRISLNMNLKDTYMIMSRPLPKSYVPYSLEGSINFSTEKYAENISEQLKRVNNKLKGKKWCVIGDSTSDSPSEGVRKYHSYIADETGIIVIDKAKAGTGFLKTYNASENICDRIDALTGNEGYDYITILAGINDSGSFTIGQCGDTTKDTVCGAIHYCCEQLTTKFPFAKIALITPTNTTYRYDYENNIRKIADEMIKIGKRFSIKVYDLNGESGLFVWNKTFTNKYFHDQTHPNSLAHQELIAPKILKFLENL